MMTEIFAQGDLLLERVGDVAPSGTVEENAEGAPLVLLEGETTGHSHASASSASPASERYSASAFAGSRSPASLRT